MCPKKQLPIFKQLSLTNDFILHESKKKLHCHHILYNHFLTTTVVPVYTGIHRKVTIGCFQFDLLYVMLLIRYSLPVEWLRCFLKMLVFNLMSSGEGNIRYSEA